MSGRRVGTLHCLAKTGALHDKFPVEKGCQEKGCQVPFPEHHRLLIVFGNRKCPTAGDTYFPLPVLFLRGKGGADAERSSAIPVMG
jgi:hypothetical protein